MGVHILCLFLSTPGPLEEQSTPQGQAQQTAPRGSRGEQRALQPCEKLVLEKGVDPKAVPVRGLKKRQESRTKAKITRLQWSSPCMSWASCVRGFPYMCCQKGNMSLVYKNYRLASEFNPYPLNSSLSSGTAFCRVSCSSGLERGEQLKIFSLSCCLLLSPGIPEKGESFAKSCGTL